jgi:Glyoxalase-like domain
MLIDCKTSDVDEAARFWGEALGRPVDSSHPGSRGNYRMLETPPDEPIVQIQRVDHRVASLSTSRPTTSLPK